MRNPTDDSIAPLEADWPAWQCWAVRAWDGTRQSTTFHARRWSGEGCTLDAASAEDLASQLAHAEAGG